MTYLQNPPRNRTVIPFVIIFIACIFFIVNSFTADTDYAVFVSGAIVALAFAVTTYGFVLYERYSHIRKLGISYLFLGLAFLSYGISETIYIHNDWFGIETYPNLMIDVPVILYYMFAILHIVYTIRHYSLSHSTHTLALFSIVSMTVVFVGFSLTSDTESFDFVYSLPFVLMSGLLVGMALYTTYSVRSNIVALPWLLIGLAIMAASGADVYYYIIENLDLYVYGDIVDTFYFGTDIMMLLGLWMLKRRI